MRLLHRRQSDTDEMRFMRRGQSNAAATRGKCHAHAQLTANLGSDGFSWYENNIKQSSAFVISGYLSETVAPNTSTASICTWTYKKSEGVEWGVFCGDWLYDTYMCSCKHLSLLTSEQHTADPLSRWLLSFMVMHFVSSSNSTSVAYV